MSLQVTDLQWGGQGLDTSWLEYGIGLFSKEPLATPTVSFPPSLFFGQAVRHLMPCLSFPCLASFSKLSATWAVDSVARLKFGDL